MGKTFRGAMVKAKEKFKANNSDGDDNSDNSDEFDSDLDNDSNDIG